MHRNATRGSGGVGIFVRNNLFEQFNFELIDKSIDGVIWYTCNM